MVLLNHIICLSACFLARSLLVQGASPLIDTSLLTDLRWAEAAANNEPQVDGLFDHGDARAQLHRTLKLARRLVEDQDGMVEVPEEDLRDLLEQIQSLQEQVNDMLPASRLAATSGHRTKQEQHEASASQSTSKARTTASLQGQFIEKSSQETQSDDGGDDAQSTGEVLVSGLSTSYDADSSVESGSVESTVDEDSTTALLPSAIVSVFTSGDSSSPLTSDEAQQASTPSIEAATTTTTSPGSGNDDDQFDTVTITSTRTRKSTITITSTQTKTISLAFATKSSVLLNGSSVRFPNSTQTSEEAGASSDETEDESLEETLTVEASTSADTELSWSQNETTAAATAATVVETGAIQARQPLEVDDPDVTLVDKPFSGFRTVTKPTRSVAEETE